MKADRIYAGLIGFGTVGTGVVKVLKDNAALIKDRLGCELVLKRVADKDVSRDRGVKLDDGVLTTDAMDIINDPEISIVIELVGGTGIAKTFIMEALSAGKHVVTANKALLSTHGKEIFQRAAEKKLDIGFEASVGGGIPVIKALREGLAANRIESIYGIINGTANYILSKMTNEGGKFEDVLRRAQEKGYAEADPSYDVDGIDTAHKLAILINLAYGTYIDVNDIYTSGISSISQHDIKFAKEFGYRIKLLAIAKSGDGKIEARVHPTMVPASHPLATVDGVYNAIHLEGNAVGSVMLYGLGAGMMPTASAVVADLMDIARNMRKGISERITPLAYTAEAIKDVALKPIDSLEIPYYIRFLAVDKPGALSKISGVLGAHNISISSVIQKDRKIGGAVPLVILTHNALERELRSAIEEIQSMDIIHDKIVYIRIEENLGAAN
ncbi:MAG: homoserine dehydrogenase [Deltaproteobacteria bacterium GWB2_55_19]|nr:MAG: homoserine dehydrogenase [Deltaproteobacteria bacterium GWB2_55_19]